MNASLQPDYRFLLRFALRCGRSRRRRADWSFPTSPATGEHSDDMYRLRSRTRFLRGDAQWRRALDGPGVRLRCTKTCSLAQFESGVPTVCLSFSSGLSGSYNTAMIIRDQLVAEHPDAELYVVDTCLASIAEGASWSTRPLSQRDQGHDGRASWPIGPRRRATSSTPSSWSMIWRRLRRGGRIPALGCATPGAKLDVKPLLNIAHRRQAVAHRRGARAEEGHQAACGVLRRSTSDDQGLRRFAVIGNADCPKDADRA